MVNSPLSLFDFVARVARLREAQRQVDMLASEYNLRQVVPLAHEVDALIERAHKMRLHPAFLLFVQQVTAMRETQGQFSTASDGLRCDWEAVVDSQVVAHTEEAKRLSEQLEQHNALVKVKR